MRHPPVCEWVIERIAIIAQITRQSARIFIARGPETNSPPVSLLGLGQLGARGGPARCDPEARGIPRDTARSCNLGRIWRGVSRSARPARWKVRRSDEGAIGCPGGK